MIEDAEGKFSIFNELVCLRATTELNISLIIKHREDNSFIDADLMFGYDLILIDDDLNNDLWGNQVIEEIMNEVDTNPDYRSVPIIYYSAGTNIKELSRKSRKWGGVKCSTFDNLEDEVISILATLLRL